MEMEICANIAKIRRNLRIRKMLDWCNRSKMLLLIGLLFLCSIFILYFGEYVEANLGINKKIFGTFVPSTKNSINEEKPTICPPTGNNNTGTENEPPLLLQSCQKCNEFERNALQSEHCRPSGFFNAFACATVNGTITVYRPCLSDAAANERRTFYVFWITSTLSTAFFWQFVRWRKEFLERRTFAYQPLSTRG